MDIKVENNIPGIKVTVNKKNNGEISILLTEEGKKKLGDIQCGDIVKLGGYEFIVLGHDADTTAVLAKDSVECMVFGGNGDWRDSEIRKFCNAEFFNELANSIGAENITKHTVSLFADDGTGKELSCEDKISILTTYLYRQYREYIPVIKEYWWTATRVTHDKKTGYANHVCHVNPSGVLTLGVHDCGAGVRPFCILNSSILVP